MAADSFFGFDTQMPTYEDEELAKLDPSLSNLDDDNFDLHNDDTFGSGALEDDWEIAHKQLAGVSLEEPTTAWNKNKPPPPVTHKQYDERHRQRTGIIDDEDEETNLEEEEEMLEQTLAKLVDEDEVEPPKHYASSGYKDIPRVPSMPSAWNGTSPLSSPTSSSSLHELISPSSNIWASPSRLHMDEENTMKGSSNIPPNQTYSERKKTPGRRPYSPAFEDDAIIKAMPKPETLLPPSSFTKKPPVNVIRLEDLEKEFADNSPSPTHQRPEQWQSPVTPQHPRASPHQHLMTPQQPLTTPQQLDRGTPPPGIPHPMMTPQGPMMTPQGPMMTPQGYPQMSPSPRMQQAPPGMRPFPMPPQMFQGRPMTGKQPLPSMGGPAQGFMRTPPPQFQRPPLPTMHSDPAHLMNRGGMMNFQMTPQRQRFSTPQPYSHPYRNPYDHRGNQYDNRGNYYDNHGNQYNNRGNQYDNRGYYQQRRGQGQQHDDNRHMHQHTDLEKKIHEIVTRDEHITSNDPYAGLMTRREKEWIIKIQLLQLTSSTPDLDDYYFQTYLRRKQAKERAKQGEESTDLQNRGGTTAQMALPQFERETRNYKPLDFQGTLGKVAAASLFHPRQMVEIDHISKATDQEKQTSSSTKDIKRRRQILSVIEKAYDYLLQLDDLERKLIHVAPEDRNVLLETKQSTGVKLFSLLKLNIRTEGSGKCDEDFFVQLLSIRKGKVLLSRMLPALKQPQAEAVLLSMTCNIIPVIKKDSQDEVLPLLIVPVTRVVEQGSSAVIFQSLKHMAYGDKDINPQPSSLSTILANQFGINLLNSLLRKSSSVSSSFSGNMGEFQQSWEALVRHVAKEFTDVPVKLLAKNILAVTPLVGVLVGCTSPHVSADLQEHYRNAVSTKEDV